MLTNNNSVHVIEHGRIVDILQNLSNTCSVYNKAQVMNPCPSRTVCIYVFRHVSNLMITLYNAELIF